MALVHEVIRPFRVSPTTAEVRLRERGHTGVPV